MHMAAASGTKDEKAVPHNFMVNDPFDRTAPIRYVLPQLIASADFMQSIRDFQPKSDEIAIWFMGQNGFLLKDSSDLLIGIDLYLTDSLCHHLCSLAIPTEPPASDFYRTGGSSDRHFRYNPFAPGPRRPGNHSPHE